MRKGIQWIRHIWYCMAGKVENKKLESHYTRRIATWFVGSTNKYFFSFFPLPFPRRYQGLQNCHPCVMSFLLFINFLFLISPWPYLCIVIYIIVRINKQRDKSFEFSSILSTVDLSKHLVTAWIIRKFIQLVNFVTSMYSFISFSAIDRVWLNLYERALSGNEKLQFIKTFVREFIQCRTFLCVLYWVRNARSAFYTWVRILYPVRNA